MKEGASWLLKHISGLAFSATALLAVTIMWTCAAMPVRAASAPTCQVIVMWSAQGMDAVNITYPTAITDDKAQQDLVTLSNVSSWHLLGAKIDQQQLALPGATVPPMTSVTFAAPGATSTATGGFALEPLILALKTYRQLNITYIMPDKFQFAGLSHYADSHVNIALDQHGNVFDYAVQIKDPSFSVLNLPATQAECVARAAVGTQGHPSLYSGKRDRLIKIAAGCIIFLALIVGVAVYVLTSRLTAPQKDAVITNPQN
jgi:hypothetical protein